MCLITGCSKTPEPAKIVNTNVVLPSQAALVSVQPTGPATAEVIVKLTSAIKPTDWRLTAQTASGTVLALNSVEEQVYDPFSLTILQLSALNPGQAYTLRLGFRYNQKDTLTLERTYTHTTYNPWKRLAQLPFNSGDFTGSIVSFVSDLDRTGSTVQVTRYVDAETWQRALFNYQLNTWYDYNPPYLTLRRGLIEYVLYYHNVDRSYFYGMGYQTDDLFPDKYIYSRDLYAIFPAGGSRVFPYYQGEDGEVVYFTTTEWAFFLTNNGSPAMRGIYAQFDQEARAPLPEKPGIMATFSLGETGYVVNQVLGSQPHLFAYDSQKDIWTRKADFPGTQRSRGIGFSVNGKGYFGLGTASDQRGLRDIWQYDPATDKWQYLTDYPGQGNRYLVVWSGPKRAYLGWGYESQTEVESSGHRLVGCTDFWEFAP
ncbi:MAG: hypothetical protein J0I82_28710 [Spirosoma sp.]|uniref:hypothetical protein n=1 Tax=Spirosoma sp. 48-14 TaxID=1895854 RepID=UPI000967F75E|nr:hypothetical protein [Spirosoma sp. 48-14]MBN8826044.1 hypothetical protein [Spirosoma sp.]OJW75498.1 MAG: hypothetical protein BGO59_08120 [Spirosoma sp. 48-14]